MSSATTHAVAVLKVKPLEPVALFWDIENVHVPKGVEAHAAADAVCSLFPQAAQKSFEAYCNISVLSSNVATGLSAAGVKLVHVPPGKNGADLHIIQAVNDFITALRVPAQGIVVLLTSDANFLPLLQSIRRKHPGVRILLFHNSQANKALVDAADASIEWGSFHSARIFTGSSKHKPGLTAGVPSSFGSEQPLGQHQTAKGRGTAGFFQPVPITLQCPVCSFTTHSVNHWELHVSSKGHQRPLAPPVLVPAPRTEAAGTSRPPNADVAAAAAPSAPGAIAGQDSASRVAHVFEALKVTELRALIVERGGSLLGLVEKPDIINAAIDLLGVTELMLLVAKKGGSAAGLPEKADIVALVKKLHAR